MVGHKASDHHGECFRETCLHGEVRHVISQRLIQTDFPLFSQLHCRSDGEKFRHRSKPIDGFGGSGNILAFVRKPKSFGPDHLLVVNQGDTQPLEFVFPHFLADQPAPVLFGIPVITGRKGGRPGGRRGGAGCENEQGEEKQCVCLAASPRNAR